MSAARRVMWERATRTLPTDPESVWRPTLRVRVGPIVLTWSLAENVAMALAAGVLWWLGVWP